MDYLGALSKVSVQRYYVHLYCVKFNQRNCEWSGLWELKKWFRSLCDQIWSEYEWIFFGLFRAMLASSSFIVDDSVL